MDGTKLLLAGVMSAMLGCSGSSSTDSESGDTDPGLDSSDASSGNDTESSPGSETSTSQGSSDTQDDTSGGELPGDGCEGVQLQASGVLDADLSSVVVSGLVTVDGQPLSSRHGSIRFVELDTHVAFDLPLASLAEDDQYRIVLGPGAYEVGYVSDVGCEDSGQLPCGGGQLLPEVQLFEDGSLSVDIPTVAVALAVTANGGQLPAMGQRRASLEFRGEDGNVAAVALDSESGSQFAARLVPGHYDLAYRGAPDVSCETAELPCASGPIESELALMTDGSLAVDIPSIEIQGQVTLNGAAMGSAPSDRGRLSFVAEDGSTAHSDSLGTSGVATYRARLFPGLYDVIYEPSETLCRSEAEFPCNRGRLASAQSLLQSGALDLDVPTVRVSGAVTLNGGPVPSANSERGHLVFATEDGAAATEPFEAPGAITYELTVMPGTYELSYEGNAALCEDGDVGLPCGRGVLERGLALTASGGVDVDIPAITVRGRVTLLGDSLPAESGDRGSLVLTSDQGQVTLPPLGTAGDYEYETHVVPGTYAVHFAGNAALCGLEDAVQMPCIGGPLLETALNSSGSLDIDLPVVEVRGVVTLDGDPLPDAPLDRGLLAFRPVGVTVEAPADDTNIGAPLMAVDPVSYRMTMVPGNYVVTHQANPQLCGPGLSSAVPCGSQILLGCE